MAEPLPYLISVKLIHESASQRGIYTFPEHSLTVPYTGLAVQLQPLMTDSIPGVIFTRVGQM
jgi:hypothetical protein